MLKALRVDSNITHVIANKGTRTIFRVKGQKEIKIPISGMRQSVNQKRELFPTDTDRSV